ncbi:(Fe-S)-binding protein, partial [Citrobacter cronae]|uniref:(Fe-S)-binding protein n=2 Tax=Gammaproteobacteria TaxID=1236 RepID=UPI0012464A64
WRDIQAKKRAGLDTRELLHTYQYQGIDTCAATGLCAQRCPVGINTGDLVKKLRGQAAEHAKAADWLAEHFHTTLRGARLTLAAANGARKLLGAPRMARLSASLSKASKGRLPQWTPAMPQPLRAIALNAPSNDTRPRVVYLAACVSRVMGPAYADREQSSLLDKTRAL